MADLQAKPLKKSARGTLRLSIRARLIVVALVAIAPLMFERVHGLERARAERAEHAHAQVIDMARGGAEAQRGAAYSIRALLQVIAHAYARTPLDTADCTRMLTELIGNVPWLHSLGVAEPNGRITCATDQRAVGLNIGDRPYFQAALRSHNFALSDYLINRVDQTPGLIAAFPAVNEGGTTNGVVLASVNLRWIGDLAAKTAQRSGTSVMLVDGSGTLVAASDDLRGLIGKNFADHALTKSILAGDDEGTMTLIRLRRHFCLCPRAVDGGAARCRLR